MAKAAQAAEKSRLETGMLSFARSLQPSEGLFVGTRSKDDLWRDPVEVREKGVRGQSSEFKTNNPGKSNPQVVETATVPPGCDGVRLEFTMWVLPHARKPWACDDPAVRAEYEGLVSKYAEKGGFNFLARRYLWNIANARFAWRNRFQADHMRVKVKFDGREIVFDPSRLSLEQPASLDQLRSAALSNEPTPVEDLIAWMARGLKEKDEKGKFMSVDWQARMAEGQEVFPSQEYLRGDQDELKRQRQAGRIASRVLAKIPNFERGREVNQASMHSQKIGAALRHIDTWHGHPDYNAIAVNPYGGVQEAGVALRAEKNRGGEESAKSLYKLRDKPDDLFTTIASAISEDEIPDDVHFFVANLVRGGVFGQ